MAAQIWKGISGWKLQVGREDSGIVTIQLNDEDVRALSKNLIELLQIDIECVPDDIQLWLDNKRQCRSCEGDGEFEGVPTPNGHAICTECKGTGSMQR